MNDDHVDELVAREAKRAIEDGTKLRAGREVPNTVQMNALALKVFDSMSVEDGVEPGYTKHEAGDHAFGGYPEIGDESSPEATQAKNKLRGIIWGAAAVRRNSPVNTALREAGRPERVVELVVHRDINPFRVRKLSADPDEARELIMGVAVDKVARVLDEALEISKDLASIHPELEAPLQDLLRQRLSPMLPSGD